MQKRSSSLYTNIILNLYIVFELNKWPRNPTNNFTLKDYLFCIVKLIKNADKYKFNYNGREIAFNRKGSWSFGN